jgi:hypothetical protein
MRINGIKNQNIANKCGKGLPKPDIEDADDLNANGRAIPATDHREGEGLGVVSKILILNLRQ